MAGTTSGTSIRERLAAHARLGAGGVLLALLPLACSSPPPPPAASAAPAATASAAPAAPDAEPSASSAAAVAERLLVTESPWSGAEIGGVADGVILATRNYRIHSSLRDRSLRQILPAFCEAAFDHYRTAIVDLPLPAEPMRTYIFGARSEWNRFTERKLPPSESASMLRLRRGAYTAGGEVVLHDLGRTDTLFLTAHEGWHQYTQSVFREPLPVWLEEGIATYMEGHRFDSAAGTATFIPWRNLERYGELRARGRRGELLATADLFDRSPQSLLAGGGRQLLTYYAQLWVLVHFLIEGEEGRYRPALHQLLEDAVEGRISARLARHAGESGRGRRGVSTRSGRAVLAAYFNPDFAEFQQQFEAFQSRLLERSVGTLIWRGRSPFATPPPE